MIVDRMVEGLEQDKLNNVVTTVGLARRAAPRGWSGAPETPRVGSCPHPVFKASGVGQGQQS